MRALHFAAIALAGLLAGLGLGLLLSGRGDGWRDWCDEVGGTIRTSAVQGAPTENCVRGDGILIGVRLQ